MTAVQHNNYSYFSAEFQLKNPGIFYQFKLRQNDAEPLFALVQKDSKALEFIKPGDCIPMTYYFLDRTIPAEKRATRIKYIVDGTGMGFKNHFLIALDITAPEKTP